MPSYYNECDPTAAEWLRNLIAEGHIAPGEVDTRSIEDVAPADLRGFTQCHFFAGIGVWSLALRRAGWSDSRPAWTGSCPCQPFSAAGKGDGFADERHLWPAWFWLIRECRPDTIFGEQVASKDGLQWADLVSSDLEGEAYTVGAFDTCAAGFRKPHIRQRLYWVAYAAQQQQHWGRHAGARGRNEHSNGSTDSRRAHGSGERLDGQQICLQPWRPRQASDEVTWSGGSSGLDHHHQGLEGYRCGPETSIRREGQVRSVTETGEFDRLAHEPRGGRGEECSDDHGRAIGDSAQGVTARPVDGSSGERLDDTDGRPVSIQVGKQKIGDGERSNSSNITLSAERPGSIDILRTPADWLYCRDGKWRPVEPGTLPLAHGIASRVGRLRAYGNALDVDQAEGFISAYLEAEEAGFLGDSADSRNGSLEEIF